jgi:hypothetical protein
VYMGGVRLPSKISRFGLIGVKKTQGLARTRLYSDLVIVLVLHTIIRL